MPVVQCNGADLYYEDHGEESPIVFLHGGFAGLRYFERQLLGLAEDFRTVAFDFRGHGRSEKTETGHTLPQHARDLRAVLEQLDLITTRRGSRRAGATACLAIQPCSAQ